MPGEDVLKYKVSLEYTNNVAQYRISIQLGSLSWRMRVCNRQETTRVPTHMHDIYDSKTIILLTHDREVS